MGQGAGVRPVFENGDDPRRKSKWLEGAIAPGNPADLVILDAQSATEAIATPPVNRTVIKHGRIVAQTKLERQLFH